MYYFERVVIRDVIVLRRTNINMLNNYLIKATALIAGHYGGALWPGRFIGFSLGITSFAFLTWYFMGEGINLKTWISLGLAFALIAVQLFWKVS